MRSASAPRVAQLVCADAERLPFAAAAFDIVISSDLLEHLPDAETHLAEVARVLRAERALLSEDP